MRQSLGCWAFPGRAWERDDIQNGEQTPFGPVFSKANRNNNSSLEYFAASYGTGRGAYQSLASALTGASASLSGDGDSQGFAVLRIDETSDYVGSERQQAGFDDVWEASSTSNSSLHLTLVDQWDSTGSLSASLAADDTSTWNGSASSSATSSVDYQQHYDSVDQAIVLLGEMGWDYQALRDASFQRSANWNTLFDPSTGQFDESFTVSGDDEVLLSGYEYHPTNTNLWKTPLEEALEELFPLDYLDTTGDPPSSTDPSSSDRSGGSPVGGDTMWGSDVGWQDTGSNEDGGDGSASTWRWWNPFTWFDWGIDWSEAVDEEIAFVRRLNQIFGTTHMRLDQFTAEERARIEQALGQKFNWEAASAIRASEQALRARDKVLRSSEVSFVVAGVADALAGGVAVYEAATGVVASRALVQNPMLKHALQPFRGGLTNAGRALTKHPNIVGAKSAQELIKLCGNNAGINKAAAEALKNIMRNGTRMTKPHPVFGRVVDFKLPNGLGARFNAVTNEFIGFLGRGL